MTNSYIKFNSGTQDALLIEVDLIDPEADGLVKAGVGDRIHATVVAAQTSLESAFATVIRTNARNLLDALNLLEKRPSEAELTFGIKATGELGNFAVAKAGGEANYTIRMIWRS